MSEVPHYNVVFATPGNVFTAGYVKSMLMTVYALEREGLSWFFVNEASSHVAISRERTISGMDHYQNVKESRPQAGAFTYDKLMWIDSDIAWKPEHFARLYYSDRDIISGAYMLADRTVAICDKPWGGMLSEDELRSHDEPWKVYGVGFGFVCVKHGVFESIPKPWFGQVQEEGLLLIGEDVAWCLKAKRAGFDIWVDPAVKVAHHKSITFDW